MYKLIKIIAPLRLVLLTIFIGGVVGDIFLNSDSDINLLLLCLLWILVVKLFNFRSVITFKAIIAFLALLFFLFLVAPDKGNIERVATWIFLFLLLGIIQQFREVTS